MAILDIFKKKIKKEDKVKKEVKEEKKIIEKKEEKEKPILKPKRKVVFSYDIIKKPHISEKATNLGANNQYIFEVFPNTNKNQIKKAIEGFYNVDVLSVNIVKIPAKKRRLGRNIGFKKGYKKAIVKVKEGQKIEVI